MAASSSTARSAKAATTISRDLITRSDAETEAAAERLAGRLRPGDLLLLEGPLGAGKTTFVRGLARGLGVEGSVQSPTFQLLRRHAGSPALVHVDLYRLAETAELADLGLEEQLEDAVVVIEWGDRLDTGSAAPRARIRFESAAEQSRRLVFMEAPPDWSW